MTDSMIVEAIRNVSTAGPADPAAAGGVGAPASAADPASVSKFQAAMGVDEVSSADPIPFASEAAASWRSAQVNNQGILHRIRALTEMNRSGNVAAANLLELQYEVMNLSFQQEVVTKVADKSSSAIQTLIKNQ